MALRSGDRQLRRGTVGKLKYSTLNLPPPSYLRRDFTIEKEISRATLYATALGDLRSVRQWHSRQRRSFHARLDRLHQTRSLPHLRRDQTGSYRTRSPRRNTRSTVGIAVTSVGGKNAIITEPSLVFARNCNSNTAMAPAKASLPIPWKASTGPIPRSGFSDGRDLRRAPSK